MKGQKKEILCTQEQYSSKLCFYFITGCLKFWCKEFWFLLQMNIVQNIVFQFPWFLKISIGIDVEKAISVVSLRQYHQYLQASYHAAISGGGVGDGGVQRGCQASDCSQRLHFNTYRCETTGYFWQRTTAFTTFEIRTPMYVFKGCGNQEIASFKQALFHLRVYLWWPKQVFQVKMWSFPNPYQVGFGPKPNQITT